MGQSQSRQYNYKNNQNNRNNPNRNYVTSNNSKISSNNIDNRSTVNNNGFRTTENNNNIINNRNTQNSANKNRNTQNSANNNNRNTQNGNNNNRNTQNGNNNNRNTQNSKGTTEYSVNYGNNDANNNNMYASEYGVNSNNYSINYVNNKKVFDLVFKDVIISVEDINIPLTVQKLITTGGDLKMIKNNINYLKSFNSLYKNQVTPHIQVYYDSFKRDNRYIIMTEQTDGQIISLLNNKMQSSNPLFIKCMLFQIIYTLYAIKTKTVHKNFNHNRLHIKNVDVVIISKFGNSNIVYMVGKEKLSLPNMGFLVKIQHFYNTTDISSEDNLYKQDSDIITLLKSLYNIENLNSGIKFWIRKTLKLYLKSYTDNDLKFLKYLLLKDNIFKNFRGKNGEYKINPVFKC